MDPLDPSLSSAQRKLNRAIEHIHTLSEETHTFEHSDAYIPRVERNFRSSQEVEHVVYAVEKKTLPFYWDLLAGEAIQNLRAALDHAVFAHTNSRSSQFPIFTDPCEFQVKGKPRIKGVPKPIRTLIEEAQPYKHFAPRPSRDALALLSSLSNADKHRTLTALASVVRFPFLSYTDDRLEYEWTKPPALGQMLYDGAEVIRFVVRAKTTDIEMNVNPSFTFQVGITGRPDLPLMPLDDNLRAIARRVFEVVTEVETGQPMPLIAQYPIA